jgi:cysteine desulfuration protein SufE
LLPGGAFDLSLPTSLNEIVAELKDADRQERIEILIDFAKSLPPLPDRLLAHRDAAHRVEECQSPVYLFTELENGQVRLFADAPIESPTVRGFVSLLIQGLDGGTPEQVGRVPLDLVEHAGLTEILGMLRVRGLTGVLQRVKREVAKLTAHEPAGSAT